MSQYSGGYTLGIIKRWIKGGKRIGVEFIPKGKIPKKKVKGKGEEPEQKSYLVFFDKRKLQPLSLTEEKNIFVGYPPTPEDLSEELKKSPQGKALMQIIEGLNIEDAEVSILRSRSKKQHKMLQQTEGLEIAEKTIELYGEGMKDIKKIYSKDDKAKTFVGSEETPK